MRYIIAVIIGVIILTLVRISTIFLKMRNNDEDKAYANAIGGITYAIIIGATAVFLYFLSRII